MMARKDNNSKPKQPLKPGCIDHKDYADQFSWVRISTDPEEEDFSSKKDEQHESEWTEEELKDKAFNLFIRHFYFLREKEILQNPDSLGIPTDPTTEVEKSVVGAFFGKFRKLSKFDSNKFIPDNRAVERQLYLWQLQINKEKDLSIPPWPDHIDDATEGNDIDFFVQLAEALRGAKDEFEKLDNVLINYWIRIRAESQGLCDCTSEDRLGIISGVLGNLSLTMDGVDARVKRLGLKRRK